ncbi:MULTISPECIES: hypothetical protein [Methanosarcina]|uniref:Uncharacterized protein n=3 Tax=Methanosarcina barkeri TaxID=2208 RepID=A0A0E3QSS5_METBA|nr:MULTISPECIES: hypothetical protein [Methanosarcina]AKB53560.1 hypothetical protein MSBRM_0562 [Methanosarcina barkeri MS]AKB58333.1 hypothetical protein MSBR2_1817 [Methanosarcina barkeri 227]AKJ39121.1 hypothetical protein MCM1_2102 [Methanosarcina barkeri CM1]OED07102.1 hypothetical protein A9239_10555 [Methanosarcina sp. A14]
MIWKELVLGFSVVESCIYHSIRTIPIVTASSAEEVLFTDNLTRLTKLEVDETVKGVLPVPFPTYEVTGSMSIEGEEFSEVLLLGYEYPGVQALDWIEILKREVANPRRCM